MTRCIRYRINVLRLESCRAEKFSQIESKKMPRKSKSKQVPETGQESSEVLEQVQVMQNREQVIAERIAPERQVGPYEDRRKEMQRKLQKLVLTMRTEGYSEIDIKHAINKEKRKEERKIVALEEKRANEQKASRNDVIIIPVAWKRNHSDKIRVDATCDNVRRALYSTGLNPWLDCRREYSPGQKFAYWEHMGVQFRIEIGPDDVLAGVCRVVRSEKPGAYLEHQREKPALNLQSIVQTLSSMGLDKCKEMNTELMSDASLIEPLAADSNNLKPHEEADMDEVSGNAALGYRGPVGNKRFRRF